MWHILLFISYDFNILKYKIKAICRSSKQNKCYAVVVKYVRCFHYLEFISEAIYTLSRKYLIAFHTLTQYRKYYLCNTLFFFYSLCKIHCYTVDWMAEVKTWGTKCCSPRRQTLWNLRKVFNLISLFKSVAFAFIHIQQVIHLKKLQFFRVFFSPKLHLFFCRIIAINKMLCLDELWYCQPILLQIEVKEKKN